MRVYGYSAQRDLSSAKGIVLIFNWMWTQVGGNITFIGTNLRVSEFRVSGFIAKGLLVNYLFFLFMGYLLIHFRLFL